ncbi:LOW QUALITY PROTEIN: hypothetical protein Cgig2_002730 [Carnegiea gigantea]|uniref:Uncharacterized protein n=1 Tax=Carnegiea gigantea TaxID=171969 RepID=A0A9Q1GWT2_9CARY|nr:LOW QUALITY PROTEIN: hypothetical protein Cgig2_002730 [Carnegiea gigantea]
MEWTWHILTKFGRTLKQAVIFGAVFRISGLPVIGDMCEEFLPLNDLSCDLTKYPLTVRFYKLMLSSITSTSMIMFSNWWLDYFHRGELTLIAREYKGGQLNSKKNGPVCYKGRGACCFSSFLVKPFRFTSWQNVIQLKTFMMDALLAEGQRLSLALTVLGYIYHGLEQTVSHPDHPSEVGATLPTHNVIAWLVELFPRLYSCYLDCKCPKQFRILIHYVSNTHATLSLSQARHICRDEQFAYLRANTFIEDSQKVLCSIIDSSHFSIAEIYWLTSRVKEAFNAVEIIAKIEELIENNLKELFTNALELKLRENETLKEDRCICKMQEHFLNQKQNFVSAEGELRTTLDLKRKERENFKWRYTKLYDLEKKKDKLKNLINSIFSFNKC